MNFIIALPTLPIPLKIPPTTSPSLFIAAPGPLPSIDSYNNSPTNIPIPSPRIIANGDSTEPIPVAAKAPASTVPNPPPNAAPSPMNNALAIGSPANI